MDSFASYFAPPPADAFRWDNLKANLSPSIRKHVQNVYTNMAVMLLISAVGAYLDLTRALPLLRGGLLSMVATMGCLIAFAALPATPANENTRKYLLYGFALAKGLSLGPLLEQALYINPLNVFAALAATALLFGCFSMSVLVAGRRDMLYVGGVLSSAISVLGILSLINIFAGSRAIFSLELYLGLLVFSLYVVYDTQLMIAKAELGSRDYLSHSMELYVDLVGLFVRILIILQKREAEKEGRDRRRKRNERRR
ncbi:hypothetical protein HK104_009046 [Borealophlyctis nickersoniae]|nr:hypothetical protein HK104_009046 [Borealophlyctis nickersoniae]